MTSFTAYQPRRFAVRLAAAPKKVAPPQFMTLNLPYDTSVASPDNKPTGGCFDCNFNRPDFSASRQGNEKPQH